MVSLNKVLVAGNLTRDPELRYTPAGQPVGGLDLAINNYFLTKTGEKKEETVFIHVVVWGKQAESAKNYLTKGSPILVEGRLQMDNWETKEGEKRSRLKILAQRIQFLGTGKAGVNEHAADTGSYELENSPERASHENNHVEEEDIPF